MFKHKTNNTNSAASNRIPDFSYISNTDIYADIACQSLRPQPVIDALTNYYTTYNACGGRVKYAWGQKVDEAIQETRSKVLSLLQLSKQKYVVSFTTNATYGINMLLQQLPLDTYGSIVTSEIEHNSVFLPTMTAAKKLHIPRIVLERSTDGALLYTKEQLTGALVVVNSVSNIDGRKLKNIQQLVADTHEMGGRIIIDAAQTMAHSYDMLQKTEADAICFSAHKMYSASLGVIVVRTGFLQSLQIQCIGGGMVYGVTKDAYELLPDDLSSRLEPGLQAFGEIIALGTAIDWITTVKPFGKKPKDYLQELSTTLYEGLQTISDITIFNSEPSTVISFYAKKYDAHRLAVFLSEAGIMVRSGSFCCHYYLLEKTASPPLVRLSIGIHTTPQDIQTILTTLKKLVGAN